MNPAPWIIDPFPTPRNMLRVHDFDGNPVADIYGSDADARACAALISASPHLLLVVRKLLHALAAGTPDEPTKRALEAEASAVIARAEG